MNDKDFNEIVDKCLKISNNIAVLEHEVARLKEENKILLEVNQRLELELSKNK